GNRRDNSEDFRQDFAKAGRSIGFINLLQFGKIPELLRLFEEQTANSFFHCRPIFGLECVAQNRVGSDRFICLVSKTITIHLAVYSHPPLSDLLISNGFNRIRRRARKSIDSNSTTTIAAVWARRSWFAWRD